MNHPPAEDRHLGLRGEDLARRDRQDVPREDHHIRQFARLDGAFLVFLELGVGRAEGVTPDRLLDGDPFLAVPAAGRAARG